MGAQRTAHRSGKLRARAKTGNAQGEVSIRNEKTKGAYLVAREIVQTPDDWWNMQPAIYTKQGNDERHGPSSPGTPAARNSPKAICNDMQVGKFTWWYANGQKSVQGAYVDGEQEGNGSGGTKTARSRSRASTARATRGRWTWWNQAGKVAHASEMGWEPGQTVQAQLPLPS